MSGNAKLLERVTARPDVFGGKPIVRDMRISVEFVLSLLSQGTTQDEVLDDYPELEPEDIRACIAYAHTVIAGDTLAARLRCGVLRFLVDRCAASRCSPPSRRAPSSPATPALRDTYKPAPYRYT